MGLSDGRVPFGSVSKCLHRKTYGFGDETPWAATADYRGHYTRACDHGWWCRLMDDSHGSYYGLGWWCFCIGRATRRELMVSVPVDENGQES